MKKQLAAVFLLLSVFSPSLGVSQTETRISNSVWKVLRVLDGATPVLMLHGKENVVRLIGINARFNASRATNCLNSLIAGKEVFIELEPDLAVDSDGNAMVYIYRMPDRLFINLEIVRQGCCLADTDSPFKYARDLRTAEREAEKAQRGIWSSSVAATSGPRANKLDVSMTIEPGRVARVVDSDLKARQNEETDSRPRVVMAVYASSYDDYNKSVAAKDSQGINELTDGGNLLLVPVEVKVKILETSLSYFKMHLESDLAKIRGQSDQYPRQLAAECLIRVRILDGAYKGKTGWLPAWKLLPVE